MRQIADIIAAVLERIASMAQTAVRTVMRPVFVAGRWTLRAVTEVVQVPGRLIAAPLRAIAAGRAAGGPQAAATAQQMAEQVTAAEIQADKALTIQQTVRLLQRAAKRRSGGHDIDELAELLPAPLGEYVRKLGTGECKRLADTDARAVGEWLEGKRRAIPGVRSVDDVLELPQAASKPSRRPGASPEDKILTALRDRLIARGRQPRTVDLAKSYEAALPAVRWLQ